MNAREQRGLMIAATQNVVKTGNLWHVPSQSSNIKYTVKNEQDKQTCSCPDHQEAGYKCKHIFAVEFNLTRMSEKRNVDGSTTTTTEIITVKTTAERKTYKQPWSEYNAAQINERRHFFPLLDDLCRTIEQPPPKNSTKGGRPSTPLCDAIFAECFKVFSGELDEAREQGFIGCLPHFNSVLNVFKEETTPILKGMIEASALPFRALETKFAIDSTGFSTTAYHRWFDHKWERNGLRRNGSGHTLPLE